MSGTVHFLRCLVSDSFRVNPLPHEQEWDLTSRWTKRWVFRLPTLNIPPHSLQVPTWCTFMCLLREFLFLTVTSHLVHFTGLIRWTLRTWLITWTLVSNSFGQYEHGRKSISQSWLDERWLATNDVFSSVGTFYTILSVYARCIPAKKVNWTCICHSCQVPPKKTTQSRQPGQIFSGVYYSVWFLVPSELYKCRKGLFYFCPNSEHLSKLLSLDSIIPCK